MASSSNATTLDEFNFNHDCSPEDVTLDADLPEFVVLLRRQWVGKIVEMKNVTNITIADGILRNLRSTDVSRTTCPLCGTHVPIQVSKTYVADEALDEWRYCVKAWPIQRVFYNGVSLFHHSQRESYNIVMAMRNQPLGDMTRSYDSSLRNAPLPISSKSTRLLSDHCINSIAANSCCSRSSVQLYPRDKIKVLRMRMYFGTSVVFRRHIKLDVHRQVRVDSNGRHVVPLDGIDVCPSAWQHIMGVSETSFYLYARDAAAGVAAQPHGNTGLKKPRHHSVVATAALRVILNRNADHMPHKTRVLPSSEKAVAKVLPANFKWKDPIPVLDSHLADCGLPPISTSGLSKIRHVHFPDFNAKRPGDNFACCSFCDDCQTQRKLHQPGTEAALIWQLKLNAHLDSAMAHREFYYSKRYRSQELPDECLTIMHDKMDHFKTASLALSHKIKHVDGLTRLPISVTGMLAHGHGDVRYAHYGLHIYPHDVNYTVACFAKLLRDLEQSPKASSRELFEGSGRTSLFRALLHKTKDACVPSLSDQFGNPTPPKPLPPILHVQMDNAVSDNTNRYVFCFWSLLVAKGIFREVYVNFMLVGHTHDDIDALFGRWSMALKRESFLTVPLLMKSFMEIETVPTIPHFIEEVPNFKSFISYGILVGDEALWGHTKAHQFKFYVDCNGCPVLKYKILCHNDDWLPREVGIKLWKEDSSGRSLWPHGDPIALQPRPIRNVEEVINGVSGFISYWEHQSRQVTTGEYRRGYEPLSYYWRVVKDSLNEPMVLSSKLQDGFWPTSRIDGILEDHFTEGGVLREEFDEDDAFVGQVRDCLGPSFRVARDVYAGYFLALRPCDGDKRPIWIARAIIDPNSDPERPNSLRIQYYRSTSRNLQVERSYVGWDAPAGLRWRIDDDLEEVWESTGSLLTAWKSRTQRESLHSSTKIPLEQVAIINASLMRNNEASYSQ